MPTQNSNAIPEGFGPPVDSSQPPPGFGPAISSSAGLTTEASEHARQLAPAQPINSGLLSRFGQAVAVPTSTDQMNQAIQGTQLVNSPNHPVLAAIANGLLGPAGAAAAAVKNYGQNIYNKATAPMTSVEKSDMAVHPVGQVANQASKFLLEGPLGPFGGQAASNIAQDYSQHLNAQPGHYFKAAMHGDVAGDALGGVVNALLMRSAANPSMESRLNSLTAAGGAKTAAPFESLAKPLLDTANAEGIKSKSVGDVLNVVNKFKDNVNSEYGNALGPYTNNHINTLPISNKIMSLITPDMPMTAEGRAEIADIKRAALEYEKPGWTLGALDSKRSRLAADLASHNAKEGVARYTAERGNTNLAIDNTILDGLRDTVYPQADQLAGKPPGYFEQLKQQQSDGIRLQSLLNKRVEDLVGKSRESKGQTFMSRLRPGAAISAEGSPHGYVSNLANALNPRDVLKQADAAAARGMGNGGKYTGPVSRALVRSYPARFLSLSSQPMTPVDQK